MTTHHTKTAIRWPLNFTHAELRVLGTTPEGIDMELTAGRVVFADPTDAAIIEVLDVPDIEDLRNLQDPSTHLRPGRNFMVDLRGTMIATDPTTGELFQVKVQEPEDMERLVTQEPEQDALFPSGWSDPKDWS